MPKTKIKLNGAGMQALLTGAELTDYVEQAARTRLPAGCDIQIAVDNHGAKYPRSRVIMFPVTDEAKKSAIKDDLLVNAISR